MGMLYRLSYVGVISLEIWNHESALLIDVEYSLCESVSALLIYTFGDHKLVEAPMEGWLSGRKRWFAKSIYTYVYHGFESHFLRGVLFKGRTHALQA